MKVVAKLLREITEIEKQAESVDPQDKKALYALLIVAYYKAKDIIVAQEEIVPEPIKVIDTDRIDELEFALEQSGKLLTQAQEDRIKLQRKFDQIELVLSGKAGDDLEEHD